MKKSEWNDTPGGYDKLHTSTLFPSSGDYGIPDLMVQDIEMPKFLLPYGTEVRRGLASSRGGTVHFFLDDYRFESLWNMPVKTSSPIVRLGSALTPDFSVYSDYPRAIQIFNVYRNRYLGRYWQSLGIKVIPTIAWGDSNTYDFCFDGVPKGSIVAISALGAVHSEDGVKMFTEGVLEMIRRIKPKGIVVYGRSVDLDKGENMTSVSKALRRCKCEVQYYDSYWESKKGSKSQR